MQKRICGIYQVTNKLNGKSYIGQSIDINRRWTDHVYESSLPNDKWESNYRGCRTAFHSAIRKYGVKNFDWSILEECPQEQLSEREIFWIKELDTFNRDKGYNMTSGGDGCPLGGGEQSTNHKISLQEANLIKEKLKINWSAAEIKQLVPNATDAIISCINVGDTWFDETENYPLRSKKNALYLWSDEEAMTIKKEYATGETIMELAKKYQVDYNRISDLVHGKTYTHLPVLERQVEWQRVAKERKFSPEQVVYYRNEVYQNHKSIKSLQESCPIKCTYAAFYNMVKGITYKNIREGLPS